MPSPPHLAVGRLLLVAVLTALAAAVGFASDGQSSGSSGPDPQRFEADIAAFEAEDRATPPAAGVRCCSSAARASATGISPRPFPDGVCSSAGSAARTSPTASLRGPDHRALPAGADRLLRRGRRRRGRQDRAQIAADYRALIALIHARLPNARTIVIGTKPARRTGRTSSHPRGERLVRRAGRRRRRSSTTSMSKSALLGTDGLPARGLSTPRTAST